MNYFEKNLFLGTVGLLNPAINGCLHYKQAHIFSLNLSRNKLRANKQTNLNTATNYYVTTYIR